MMYRSRWIPWCLAVLCVFPLFGCGGDGPTSPSGRSQAVLRGVAIVGDGAGAASTGDVSALSNSKNNLTVKVEQNVSISTKVSVNGTFELEGVPEGSFNLVFENNGEVVGTVHVSGVGPESEIELVVEVKIEVKVVVVVKLEIDGELKDDEDSDKKDDDSDSK